MIKPIKLSPQQVIRGIQNGWLWPFKSDGPSDFGLHWIISAIGYITFTAWRNFWRVVRPAALEHDRDFHLGELSGKTFREANADFEKKLWQFPYWQQKYRRAVDVGGVPDTDLPWRWRFGWTPKLEKYVEEHGCFPLELTV